VSSTRITSWVFASLALVAVVVLLFVPSTAHGAGCGSVLSPRDQDSGLSYRLDSFEVGQACDSSRFGRGVWAVLVAAGGLAAFWWGALSPESRAKAGRDMQEANRRRRATEEAKGKYRTPLSRVGVKSPTGLQCPRCHGTQFSTRKSWRGRAKGSRVVCVTCGAKFKRG
jgi:hypothetical protein